MGGRLTTGESAPALEVVRDGGRAVVSQAGVEEYIGGWSVVGKGRWRRGNITGYGV